MTPEPSSACHATKSDVPERAMTLSRSLTSPSGPLTIWKALGEPAQSIAFNATSKREVSPSRTVVVTQSRSPSNTTEGWIWSVLTPGGRTSKVSSSRGATQVNRPASSPTSPSAASSRFASRPESTRPESSKAESTDPESIGARSSSPQPKATRAKKRANRIARPWPMRSTFTSRSHPRSGDDQRRRRGRGRGIGRCRTGMSWGSGAKSSSMASINPSRASRA